MVSEKNFPFFFIAVTCGRGSAVDVGYNLHSGASVKLWTSKQLLTNSQLCKYLFECFRRILKWSLKYLRLNRIFFSNIIVDMGIGRHSKRPMLMSTCL